MLLLKFTILIIATLAIGLLAFRFRHRRKLSGLLLLFCTLLTLVLIAECIYKIIKPAGSSSTVQKMFTPDSLLGYRFKNTGAMKAIKRNGLGDTVFNVTYTVLADSLAGPSLPFRKGHNVNDSNREVVFLGCSFTFGEGVNDEQTLAHQFGELASVATVNRGMNGYGIHQVYELFKLKYAGKDNSGKTFVYSFLPDHLVRATGRYHWNMDGPLYSIEGDSLVNHGPYSRLHPFRVNKLAHYGSFFSSITFIRDIVDNYSKKKCLKLLTAADLEPGYQLLEDLADMVNRSGGNLIILFWDGDKFSNPLVKGNDYETVRKKISTQDLTILTVSSAINLNDNQNFIEEDGHPTGQANKLLALFLAQHLK